MDSKRWDKIEVLVEQALALPPEKCTRFLSEACGSDYELRAEIASLLSNSDKAFSFIRNVSDKVIIPMLTELDAQQGEADSIEQTPLINKVITHYYVLQKIGSGGMGIVYKARDLRLDRFVAIKLLPTNLTSDTNAKKRFISEAKAVSALDHPNICTLFEISEDDTDRLFMVMAWYKGETLKKKIKKGILTPRQTLHYTLQIAGGLGCAHKAGFTHRDVKPANIMVTEDEVVKILDFGIAKKMQSDLTKEDTAFGSLPYMSPEQVRGEEVDHRSDIWALGVVLYEMLTGERPFRGETDATVLNAILHTEPAPVKDVPNALENIVMKCLVKDPKHRYQHTDDVLVDLKRVDSEVASGMKTLPSGKTTIPERNTANSHAGRRQWDKLRKAAMYSVSILFVLSVVVLFLRSQSAPVSAAQRSIAVLPFDNLSPDADDAYFADGIHEDIIIQLSQIGDIRPIARSSVLRYSAVGRNLQQIAKELNVVSVLEGNVRRAGDHIRVSVQLVDPHSHEILWADSYERNDLTALFDIQRSIAVEIASALQANLTPNEQIRLEERPTEVAEAYEFYLRAREYFSKTEYVEENYKRAETLLKRAIEFDPEFVHAYALLSRINSFIRWFGFDVSPKTLKDSKLNAEMAIELNPESPEAHLATGYYHYFVEWDFDKALEHFQSALQFQPNNSEIISAIAYVQRRIGKFEESVANLKSSISLDPMNPDLRFDIAMSYIKLRKYETANSEYETALSLSPEFHFARYFHSVNRFIWRGDTETAYIFLQNHVEFKQAHPIYYLRLQFMTGDFEGMINTVNEVSADIYQANFDMFPASYFLGLTYDYLDDPAQAKKYYETALSEMKDLPSFWYDDPRYRMGLGRIYAGLGMGEQAIEEGEKALLMISPAHSHNYLNVWYKEYLAFIYAQLEESEKAVEILRKLLHTPSWISVPRLKIDSSWDPIRDTPEFQGLIEVFERKND